MWTEYKDWPRTNEHYRFQPAGNKVSTSQKHYSLGESEAYTDEGVFPEARIKDYASTEQINYTLRSTESPEHNDDVRTEEQEKCKGDDINNDTSPETRIIDELDTRAIREANNKGSNPTNKFRNQGRNELHVNENSINVIQSFRPAGNYIKSDQSSHYLRNPKRLGH